MNILVLGGGGREHAITWALAKSARTDDLFVAPGNGGTSDIAQNVAGLNAEDGEAVLALVQQHAIDLEVIGLPGHTPGSIGLVYREVGVEGLRAGSGIDTDVSEGLIAFQLSIKPE